MSAARPARRARRGCQCCTNTSSGRSGTRYAMKLWRLPGLLDPQVLTTNCRSICVCRLCLPCPHAAVAARYNAGTCRQRHGAVTPARLCCSSRTSRQRSWQPAGRVTFLWCMTWQTSAHSKRLLAAVAQWHTQASPSGDRRSRVHDCLRMHADSCMQSRGRVAAWNLVVCRGRYLESGRHTRWRRLAATDEVAQSLAWAALPRLQLRIAQLSDGTVGGVGLFDCCGVVVFAGAQHSTGTWCCIAVAAAICTRAAARLAHWPVSMPLYAR